MIVLSCIRFDDGTSRALFKVLEGNAATKLTTPDTYLVIDEERVKSSRPPSSTSHKIINNNQIKRLTIQSIDNLQTATFGGLSFLGWIIKLNNINALTELMKHGIAVHLPLDVYGNTALHISVQYDYINVNIIKQLLLDDQIQLEELNYNRMTPTMISSKYGTYRAYKTLLDYGAIAVRGLEGKYNAWVLALINQNAKIQNHNNNIVYDILIL